MDTQEKGTLLRVFVGSEDSFEGKPLYEAIVLAAREAGLAGASVFKAAMGFGKDRSIRSAKLLTISTGLPVVVEIVDSEERVKPFLRPLFKMAPEALITMEKLDLLRPEGKA